MQTRPKVALYSFGHVSTFHTHISTAWHHNVEYNFFHINIMTSLCWILLGQNSIFHTWLLANQKQWIF
jgi:ABC-type transport system involved in Fe-S cluster assembly fused permease/ATPase subunit